MKTCHVFFFFRAERHERLNDGGRYKRTPSGGLLAGDGLNHGGMESGGGAAEGGEAFRCDGFTRCVEATP